MGGLRILGEFLGVGNDEVADCGHFMYCDELSMAEVLKFRHIHCCYGLCGIGGGFGLMRWVSGDNRLIMVMEWDLGGWEYEVSC